MNSNKLRIGSYCYIQDLSPEDKWRIINLFLEAGARKGVVIGSLEEGLCSVNDFNYIVWHPMSKAVTLRHCEYTPALLRRLFHYDVSDLLGAGEPTPNPWEIDCELQ